MEGQRVGGAAVCLGFAGIQQTVSYVASVGAFVRLTTTEGSRPTLRDTAIITIIHQCAIGKARQNRLCSGETLRFPCLNALPKTTGALYALPCLRAPVFDAVLYHRIIEQHHRKNKVSSARFCICAECNGFAAARLKTPQFRQGFETHLSLQVITNRGGTGISKPTLSREYIYAMAVE